MNKKKFCLVVYKKLSSIEQKKLELVIKNTLKILPNKNNLFILDMSFFCFSEKFKFKKKFSKNGVNYVKISNLHDIKLFSEGYKCFCFGFVNRRLNEFLILFLLKIYNFKLISHSNVGFFANISDYSGINLLLKIRFFLLHRFNYYIYRFLLSLRLTPPINFFFESSNSRIQILNKLHKNKNFIYKKVFPPYYQNIIRINSELSNFKIKKVLQKNKIITFIDSGLGHDDNKKLNFNNQHKNEKFYNALEFFLKNLQMKIKKKVFFCLHPKSEYSKKMLNKLKQNFIVKVGTKDSYIYKSDYVIIAMSSMLNKIILLNKKLIIINSTYLSNWINKKTKDINNQIKLSNVNIDQYKFDLNKVLYKSSLAKKKYSKFIYDNLIENRKLNYYDDFKNKLNNL